VAPTRSARSSLPDAASSMSDNAVLVEQMRVVSSVMSVPSRMHVDNHGQGFDRTGQNTSRDRPGVSPPERPVSCAGLGNAPFEQFAADMSLRVPEIRVAAFSGA
jgi:hypothetical protein